MTLRVVTFNAWALPFAIAPDVEQRMRATAAAVARMDADVVALQEVWTDAAWRILTEGTAAAGYVPHAVRPGVARGGLLLLTRRPVRAVSFRRYRLRGHAERLDRGDYWGGKGFVRLEIDAPAGPCVVVATHLHARYAPPDDVDLYHPHRVGQVVESSPARSAPRCCRRSSSATSTAKKAASSTGCWRISPGCATPPSRSIAAPRRRDRACAGARPAPGSIRYTCATASASACARARSGPCSTSRPRLRSGSSPTTSACSPRSTSSGIPGRRPRRPASSRVLLAAGIEALRTGEALAERRRQSYRALATLGVAGGATAAAVGWRARLQRRRFLGALLLGGGALLALPGGAAALALAGAAEPPQIRAFRELEDRLAALADAPGKDDGATGT